MNEQAPFIRTFDDVLKAGGATDLSSLISSFAKSAEDTNTNLTAGGLTRLKSYLAGEKLRYFVYRSSGFGNQANTVNLLKRMISLGFDNEVELIYDATPGSEVIDKLAVLLPGLDPSDPKPYNIGTVKITFFPYTEKASGSTVTRSVAGLKGNAPICINGGAEITSITDQNLANTLLVDFYIQLQPYMWEIVNTADNPESLVLQKGATKTIDLLKQETLQGQAFAYRAFGMPTPEEPDWAKLLEIPDINADVINRAKALSDAVAAGKVMSFPMYGLYDKPFARKPVLGDASDMAFELIAASAIAQKSGKPFNRPIVVSLLNGLQDSTWETLSDYFPLNGEELPDVETAEFDQDEKITYFVKRWCAKQGLIQPSDKGGGNIYIEPTIKPAALTTLLGKLGPTDVVVIGLPYTPQDLFNYLYQIAILPSVFEGQGTANLALNLQKPFFKLAKTGINPYPSDLGNSSGMEEGTATALSEELFAATFNLIQLGTYQFKNGFKDDMPPTLLANLLIKQAKDYSNNGPYRQYYDGLKTYYAAPANDKLLQGLVFLVTAFDLGDAGARHSLRALADSSLAAGDATPLEQLYQQIENAISKGVLSLIPTVIPNGPFADFITAIIEGTNFSIGTATSPVQVTFPAAHDKITIIGRTSDFLGTSLTVTVEFTMNADGKTIDTAMELEVGEVSLNGVEWFKLNKLTISSTVPGNDNRLTGNIALQIELGGNPISFAADFPTSGDGKVVIDGDLTANPPSLNSLFQFLGGMNFINTLPSEISGAGNIALQNVKFGYNYKTTSIETFSLKLANSTPWPLFGKLTLNNLEFDMSMVEPTGVRAISWSASTTAAIGADPTNDGTIDVSVTYPNLTVSASLTEGSKPIPVGDLVTFFLPPEYTINLNANLGAFSMNVTPGQKGAETVYAVSAGIDLINWDLSLGVAKFSLTNIYVNVEGTGTNVPTGTLAATTVLFSDQPAIAVTMNLTAGYAGKGAWSFAGVQGDNAIKVKQIIQTYLGDSWWVDGMPNMDISQLAFNVESPGSGADTTAKSYMVGGTITIWDTPLGNNFQSIITGKFGSGTGTTTQLFSTIPESKAVVPVLGSNGMLEPMQKRPMLTAEIEGGAPTSYGNVSAQIIWNSIDLTVFYNYAPGSNTYGFMWGPLMAEIDSVKKIATLKFTESTSLGAMVETFISWLTGSKFGLGAPWNLLDKITLSNFEIVWSFKENEESVTFSVDVGPIDLIFAKVTGFKIEYVPTGQTAKQGVNVALEGKFLWLQGNQDSLGWDASDPTKTPAPPGGGNKYLDLRLLAAGQHVKVAGLQQITSVQEAIKILGELPVPSGDTVPSIGFDAGNNWLFATDFGVLKIETGGEGGNGQDLVADEAAAPGYVFTLQIVFTDPTLYALRIALEGAAAKIFAGLDFQIIYRKLSEGLGVFSAEITLPTIMRRIDVGTYSITLPTFGVDIYTNGDFRFDIGFPWNEDFGRSFSVEAIVYPGIPVLGSGGFYFGKLPAIAVTQLPKATNGFFNPNLVFGFGAQLGLGKSIEVGILSAGFSLTVFGIIEGLIAKWNPYDGSSTGGGSDLSLQGEYFFWLRGTVGVLGRLYGSVDFVVVKASVDIRLKLYVQLTLASYEPIPITASASVSASAKIKINLGLFSISLSFSFSVHITETFTLGALQNPNDAPWTVAKSTDNGRLLAPHAERHQLRPFSLDALGQPYFKAIQPNWNNLLSGKTPSDPALTAYLGYGLTVAGDDAFTGSTPDLGKQIPAYIASLFIEAPGAAQEGDRTNTLRAAGATADTAFESLAKMVARWAVSSVQTSAMTPDQIDQSVISSATLSDLIDYLGDAKNVPMPLSAGDIDTFLSNQFVIEVGLPTEAGTAEATYFPMALNLNVKMPAYASNPNIDYNFAGYNTVSSDFVTFLRDYFNQLAVQVQEESGGSGLYDDVAFANDPISVASFIFSDYFVLVMRQMLQAMKEGLRDFKYELKSGDTGNAIVGWVNTTGDLASISQLFSLYDLFKGNESTKLTVGKIVKLPYVSYSISAADTFTTIAANAVYGGAFDATALATNNADMAGILVAGQNITYSSTAYTISGSESLNSLAAKIGVDLATLLSGSDILTNTKLLTATAQLTVPPYGHTVISGDTLQSIATANGITVQDLAGVNPGGVTNPIGSQNGDVADLFDSAITPDIDLVYLPQFNVGELIAEAQRVSAINHLSGMASRYYFHGMRLPTDKITPNKEGMWVSKDGGGTLTLPDYAGLFSLTGQQLPISSLPVDPLAITLGKSAAIDWLTFADAKTELVFTITPPAGGNPGDSDYLRIAALNSYGKATVLPAGPSALTLEATAEDEPTRYPLSSGIDWQSSAPVVFPVGGSAATDRPRLWPLPSSMVALSEVAGLKQSEMLTQTSPNFTLQSVQMDEATGSVTDTDLTKYGWASSVDFTVKKLPEDANASSAYKATYEISGASADAAVILERIVQYVTDDSAYASLAVGFQAASSSAGMTLAAEVGPKVSFGISQVNLSTVTQPPSLTSFTAAEGAEDSGTNILNKPTELMRLLWEASITRSGGFYLYYFDADSSAGLPDAAFNDKGEATLTLVAMFQNEPRLQPYMNAVATGDPVDTSSANVVAKAISVKVDHAVVAGDTLSSIAGRYYSNLVSVIDNTAVITLDAGASFNLNNGVYQVPKDGSAPGGKLADIASYFQMDAAAIKAANPRVPDSSWTAGLAPDTAIRLPAVSRVVGTNPGGGTLDSVAKYYGTSRIALAGDNASVTPLLKAGQNLSVMTGPLSQHGSSQVSGVQPMAATRSGLPDVPDDPSDPNFAVDFLLNDYTLLAYQVEANFDFNVSNIALPLSQKGDSTSQAPGKVRFAREFDSSDALEYSTSIPYVQFAKDATEPDNPYSANGRLLQTVYNWNDLYGNRIVSDLDDASTSAGAKNNIATLTGYTDKLIGTPQWPSTSTNWTVADTNPAGDQFLLQITSAFDPSSFNPSTGDTADAWIMRAKSSLWTLNQILDQINDPNGIAFTIQTSLLASDMPIDAAQIGTGANYGKSGTLTGWWIPIQTFLSARAKGDSSAPEPTVLSFTLQATAKKADVVSDEIFLLTLGLNFARTGGIAEGDFAAIPEVKAITSSIPAKTNAGDSTTAAGSNANVLLDFAKDIQATLSVTGQYDLTVASGTDRYAPAAGTSQAAIWGIRLGDPTAGKGISYQVNDPGKPEIFAPEPISNTLISKGASVYPYTALTDYDPATNAFTTTATTNSYTGVEADIWVRQFFTFFDTLLSPEYTSSILVVDAKATNKPAGVGSYLTALADQKETLAQVASLLMAPVYKGQTSTRLASAQETFRQSLLGQLSNLYTTQAGLSFGATVAADIPLSSGEETPQLFGNLNWTTDPQNIESLVTLTSPKMPLATGTDQPITFLLEAPEQLTVAGEVVQEVSLALQYQGAAIEHQVSEVAGIKGYVASSWLSPIQTGTQSPLAQDLGSFTVPILLRAFPSTPRMNTQTGVATNPGSTVLNDLTQWTYGFTYSLDFHFEQDRVYSEVSYNIADVGGEALVGFVDAFQALAQFITYQNSVTKLIRENVPEIDATTTDQSKINNASLALGAFLKMATDVASQADQAGGLKMLATPGTLAGTETYNFYIEEATQTFKVGTTPTTAWVIGLISIDGPPTGLTGNPAVIIEGYDDHLIDTLSDPTKGVYAYYYTDNKGDPLTGAQAQSIAARDVSLPGMQILARQDALSTVYLTRNENIGGAINQPFVYKTPEVSFGNPLHPTIKSAEPVPVATLGSGDGKPVTRSLDAHLTALFTALFENSFDGDSTIQLNAGYDYAFTGQLTEMSVPIPVAVMPPLSVNIGGQGQSDITVANMVTTVSDAIAKWADTYAPSNQSANLIFGLTIMSNLTENPMPLLGFSDLILEVQYISPAL